jgi:energy-coupling factor transporter transmembrane protein EcfT
MIGWIILTILNYYYIPYFIFQFVWLGLLISLFILTLIQIVKLIKERKVFTRLRVQKIVFFLLLFFLTFFYRYTQRMVEKVDWYLFFNKRSEIVQKVKIRELNPNVEWNDWVCELPFEFPVISNGGNDIGIFRDEESNTVTIRFWVFRDYWDDPSTYLIYTNNTETIKRFEERISKNPDENWKRKENWYRIGGF